jgi:hypothetical protein
MHLDHDRNLLISGRRATTVSVWQDNGGDVYIASSDGTFEFGGHAEPNIAQASLEISPNAEIYGGNVVSYTIEGANVGIRRCCDECVRTVLTPHQAVDVFERDLRPDPPALPQGWNSEVSCWGLRNCHLQVYSSI